MTKEQPILTSNIRGLMFLLIGFMIAIGLLIFKLVGFDKITSNLSDSPIAFGLTLILLIGLFFILPLMLLLRLKRIEIYKSGLVISYPFRQKRIMINYTEIDSFDTYEGDARGFRFKEICIKIKNDRKIKFTSASNTNFKKCISTLSKMIKNE